MTTDVEWFDVLTSHQMTELYLALGTVSAFCFIVCWLATRKS